MSVVGRPGPKPGYRQSPEHAAKRGAARKFWTARRLWDVMTCVEQGMDDTAIAAQMGVTPDAVRIVRKRNGIRAARYGYLSARRVGNMLGVDGSAVSKWIRRGWLPGQLDASWGPHGWWYIQRDDLNRFIEDARYWHTWQPEHIADEALREWVMEMRAGVRYLTVGEVAHRLYVQPSCVNHWIRRGWLPARRWGNHWIDERDLDVFELPRIGGRRKVRTSHDE